MTIKDYNLIFAKNLNYYMEKFDLNNVELSEMIDVSHSSVAAWRRGEKSARMKSVDAMCKVFGISRSALITDHSKIDQSDLINEETKEIAEEIFNNPEMRMLFNAARGASAEDLQTTYQILKALKDKEKGRAEDD